MSAALYALSSAEGLLCPSCVDLIYELAPYAPEAPESTRPTLPVAAPETYDPCVGTAGVCS